MPSHTGPASSASDCSHVKVCGVTGWRFTNRTCVRRDTNTRPACFHWTSRPEGRNWGCVTADKRPSPRKRPAGEQTMTSQLAEAQEYPTSLCKQDQKKNLLTSRNDSELWEGGRTLTRGSDARFILYGWDFPSSEDSGDHSLASDLRSRDQNGNTCQTPDTKSSQLVTLFVPVRRALKSLSLWMHHHPAGLLLHCLFRTLSSYKEEL